MSIKLNAQSGGSVALDAPTQTTSSADLTLTLPVADGTSGQALTTNGSGALSFATVGGGAGSLIETVVGQCDGRTISVSSGNYTLQNVTAHQDGTDSFADLTGTAISYTPPTGTKRVVYKFTTYHHAVSNSGIGYIRLMVDNTEVTQAREVISYDYNSYAHSVSRLNFQYTFICDATSQDVANGKFTSWTSAKALKMQTMRHAATYANKFHAIRYWESGGSGSATSEVKVPMLTIQSFA